jgi:phosphocarrier protein FPr
MGVDALSVTPPAIPTVKEAVRAVNTVDAQPIVKAVLASGSAASVRARLNGD